jgi:hypothetical protein
MVDGRGGRCVGVTKRWHHQTRSRRAWSLFVCPKGSSQLISLHPTRGYIFIVPLPTIATLRIKLLAPKLLEASNIQTIAKTRFIAFHYCSIHFGYLFCLVFLIYTNFKFLIFFLLVCRWNKCCNLKLTIISIYFLYIFFSFFVVHLFTYAYIVWVISSPCPLPHPYPHPYLSSRQVPFCPYHWFCWRNNISIIRKTKRFC